MEDNQYDGASVDEIRVHFEKWVDVQDMRDKNTMYRMCMVIDEESLQTLMDAPPAEERKDGLLVGGPVRFVKAVEAWPETEDDPIPGSFPGWMKCDINSLWDLWTMMVDGDEMSMSWDIINENGVYGAV
jgi:hypothetical protein